MATPKKYLHDHYVLLLLSINVFLSVAGIILVVLKLISNHGNSSIVQYRPSVAFNTYQTGSSIDLVSFTVFAAIVLGINTALSYKVYRIHRQLAITVLSLGVLELVLNIIISNALLLFK
jgi:hypothetical protein